MKLCTENCNFENRGSNDSFTELTLNKMGSWALRTGLSLALIMIVLTKIVDSHLILNLSQMAAWGSGFGN